MKLSHLIKLYNNFDVDIALSAFLASRFKSAAHRKNERIFAYLKAKYSDVISKYQYVSTSQERDSDYSPIWTLWWQGEENIPEVVKTCFDSMNNNRGSHQLLILNKNNFRDYVNLPEYVMKKFEAGSISITHLSEIIREYLLSRYGGLWLDSTIFAARKIPDEIFNMNYFTVKRPVNNKSRFISRGQWTSAVQASRKGDVMSSFIYDFLIENLRCENCFIDYFLIDYVIRIALEEIHECRENFEAIPLNNLNFQALHGLLNSRWDDELYDKLKNDTYFFKLAWRTQYKNLPGLYNRAKHS